MELEAALEETKKEAMCGGFAPRDKKDPSEWIPRGPERMTLNGHRSPITRVLFHPQFNLLVTSSEDSQIKVSIIYFLLPKYCKKLKKKLKMFVDMGFRIWRL